MQASVIYLVDGRREGFTIKAKTEKAIEAKIVEWFGKKKLDHNKCHALYRITKK